MALVTEDGTGIPNANSYGTIAGARSYALDRGFDLSAFDDAKVSSWLIVGTDFLESFQYVGSPVEFDQSLSWPRMNVQFAPGFPFPNDQLPVQLVSALYQCVVEQSNGIDLQPTTDNSTGGFVIEEKVDVLMEKFSEKIGTTSAPLLPRVMALLRGLLIAIPPLKVIRV